MLKNIIKFFFSDIVAKALAVIFIPFFAYYLGPKELGLFAEWFSLYNIFIAIFSIGIPTYILVLLTSIPDNLKQDSINRVLTFYIQWLIVIIPTVVVIFIVVDYLWYGVFIIICSISFPLLQFYQSILRFENRIKHYFYFQNILTICTSLIPLVAVIISVSWLSRVFGLMLSLFLFLLFIIRIMSKNFVFVKLELNFKIDLVKFGFPIVLLAGVSWIKLFIDIQLLKNITSYESSGILFFAFQVISIISILAASLNRSSTPSLFKLLSNNDLISFFLLILKLSLILFVGLIFTIIFSELLIKYSLTQFSESLEILYPMLIGIFFYGIGQFISSIFLYNKKTYINAICVIVSSMLHPVISYYIINNLHWQNIGYAYLISNLIFFVLVIFYANKSNKYMVKNLELKDIN